jgi:hypothetical protein
VTYDWVPGHDVKIVLGDMNAKIRKEAVYRPTTGTYSVHNECNRTRLVDFANSKSTVITSTCFPHKPIHLATWCSPDGVMANQIDHVLTEWRHGSDIFNVSRGTDCNSDHYLVRIKYRQKISNVSIKAQIQTRFNTSI